MDRRLAVPALAPGAVVTARPEPKGLPVRYDLDPDPPRWVLDLYREEQAR